MSGNTNNETKIRALAERIYDLDAQVYASLGSSLGRVFNRDRDCLLYTSDAADEL